MQFLFTLYHRALGTKPPQLAAIAEQGLKIVSENAPARLQKMIDYKS
jgi:hypothetical protein